MDQWSELERKYMLGNQASNANTSDPWGELEKQYAMQAQANAKTAPSNKVVQPQVQDPQEQNNFGMLNVRGTLNNAKNALLGLVKGSSDIGSTAVLPYDMVKQKARGEDFFSLKDNLQRREDVTSVLTDLGADPNSLNFRGGRLGANIMGTAGTGSLIANTGRAVLPAAVASRSAPLLAAVESGGMTAGNAGIATRALGGGINGLVSSAIIDPREAQNGAVIGAVLPPALKVLASGGNSIRNMMLGQGSNAELANKAINQYKIPLGMSDISGNETVKATRSVLNDLPFIGRIGARQNNAKQEAFNRAVGGTFGADSEKLTSEVLKDAKTRMGNEFDRIWGRNVLQVDGEFMRKMVDLSRQAEKLPRNEADSLRAELNDLYSKIVTDEAGNPVIAGDVANNFQSYLRRRAESSSGLKNELSDLRQNILSTFNRGVAPADAAALTLNRSQYKAFKTLEPLLNKGEAGVAGREAGDVPAALLPSAVANNYSSAAGTPLAELSKIGSKYLVDRVARTGGSPRALVQNSLLGGALTASAYAAPKTLAIAPAAWAVNAMLGNPTVAKKIINSNLGNVLDNASPELLQFLYQSAPAITTNR